MKKRVNPEIEIEEYPEWAWKKPTKAVIAGHAGGDGVILFWAGPHLRGDVCFTGEEGFDDIPDGISVWEGITQVEEEGDGDEVYDMEVPCGTFRELTDDEWQAVKENRCPWDLNDWLVQKETN